MSSMSIRWKLMIPLGLLVLLFSASAVTTELLVLSSGESGTEVNLAGRQRMLSQRMTKQAFEIRFADTAEEREAIRERFRVTVGMFDETLAALLHGGDCPSTTGGTSTLPRCGIRAASEPLRRGEALWAEILPVLEPLVETGPMPGDDEIEAAAGALWAHNEELLTLMNEATSAFAARADDSMKAISAVQLVGLGLGLMIAAATIYAAERVLIGPVRRVAKELHRLAHIEGDLSRRLKGRRRDEIGKLDRAYNDFSGKVSGLVVTVRSVSDQIGESVGVISGAMQKVSMVMNQQAAHVDEVVFAATEAGEVVAGVTERSEAATRQADEAGRTASRTGELFHAIIEDLEAIRASTDTNASSIERLAERGQAIGSVIDLINEIAEQTNLLALNAAIEAARAGEHGRGFAVVADEVRKLAERTTGATAEISASIGLIQTETSAAMRAMAASGDRVRTTAERASAARGEIDNALRGSQEVARLVQDIADAARRQTTSTEEVSKLSNRLGETMSGTAAVASETSGAIEMLRIKTGRLLDAITAANLNPADDAIADNDDGFYTLAVERVLDAAVGKLLAA